MLSLAQRLNWDDGGQKVIDLTAKGIKFFVEGANVTYINGKLVANDTTGENVEFSFDPAAKRRKKQGVPATPADGKDVYEKLRNKYVGKEFVDDVDDARVTYKIVSVRYDDDDDDDNNHAWVAECEDVTGEEVTFDIDDELDDLIAAAKSDDERVESVKAAAKAAMSESGGGGSSADKKEILPLVVGSVVVVCAAAWQRHGSASAERATAAGDDNTAGAGAAETAASPSASSRTAAASAFDWPVNAPLLVRAVQLDADKVPMRAVVRLSPRALGHGLGHDDGTDDGLEDLDAMVGGRGGAASETRVLSCADLEVSSGDVACKTVSPK